MNILPCKAIAYSHKSENRLQAFQEREFKCYTYQLANFKIVSTQRVDLYSIILTISTTD